MPKRNIIFAENEIYHVINRGVLKKPIFRNSQDYIRFVETINFYIHSSPRIRFSFFRKLNLNLRQEFWKELQTHKPLTEILSFCLMPNHFHFLLRQKEKNGITTFMKNLQTSYALYFNTRHNQSGHLFKSAFRAIRIENDDILLHVSRYIHLNPVSSYLIELKDLWGYRWSSLPSYLGSEVKKNTNFINTKLILDFFNGDKEKYRKFIYDQVDYQRKLQMIKSFNLER